MITLSPAVNAILAGDVIEAFYLIRITKDTAGGAGELITQQWTFDVDEEGWTAQNIGAIVFGGAYAYSVTGPSPNRIISPNLSVVGSTDTIVRAKVRITGGSWRGLLYYKMQGDANEYGSVLCEGGVGGLGLNTWEDLEWNLEGHPVWEGGIVEQIRFDLSDDWGDLDDIQIVRPPSDPVIYSLTSYFDDITLSDGSFYDANGTLVALDPPQASSNVDREQYKISISDPSFLAGEHVENGLIGKNVSVRIGVVDPDTDQPLTDIADTLEMYRGRIDSAGFSTDVAQIGENLLNLSCSSPMANLDMKRGLYLSRDSVRGRNHDDACCDQVYENSSGVVLKWGKD